VKFVRLCTETYTHFVNIVQYSRL